MSEKAQTSLLLGLPISINDKFYFKMPIMKDIFNINFNDLMSSVSIFYDLNYVLYRNEEINSIIEKEDYKSYDSWQLVIMLESESKTMCFTDYFINCLKYHISDNVKIDLNFKTIIDEQEFDRDDYECFCKILKIAYGLEERIEDRIFECLKARRKAIEIRINRNEIYAIESKTNDFLYQVVSSLKTKKSDEEIQKSNLFQLIDLYKRINKEKDYDSFMAGVYTGNVDTKKIDISKKHWTSKLS